MRGQGLLIPALALTATLLAGPSVAKDDAITVGPGASVVVSPLDNDEVGGTATITSTSPAALGQVILAKDGRRLIYVANEEATGTESISYTVDDAGIETSFNIRVDIDDEVSDAQLDVIGEQLLLLLVLAILLEQGLSVIFNWRPFLVHFDGRGFKTPIAIVTAYLFIEGFDINSVNEIVRAFTDTDPRWEWPGQMITALIVAGGSALVFRLFESFGLRAPFARQREAEAQREKAHVRIQLQRSRAKSEPALVLVDDLVVGGVKEGELEAPRGLLTSGFVVEPGTRKIGVSAVVRENSTDTVVDDDKTLSLAPGANVTVSFTL